MRGQLAGGAVLGPDVLEPQDAGAGAALAGAGDVVEAVAGVDVPALEEQAALLDALVLESLLRTYEDQQLLDQAVQQYLAQARANRPNHLERLAALEAEIRKADEALDRYFNAFEAGSMSVEMCRPRIERLAERLRGLRARQAELTAAIEDEQLIGPDPDQVETLKGEIKEAMLDGPSERRKGILQELVAEVLVESRSCIRPTLRLPLGEVFPVSQMVHPGSQNKNPAASVLACPIDLAEPSYHTGERRSPVRGET
jgi:hypothetical protein